MEATKEADLKFLKIAAEATTAAADGLREDNIRAAEREPRFQKQASIEAAIMAFRPDFYEAEEIVAAIRATLCRRYDPEDYTGKDLELVQAVHDAGDAFARAIDAAYMVPQ